MISLEDCLALCDLMPDEVAAICEHEHVPEMIARGRPEPNKAVLYQLPEIVTRGGIPEAARI